MPRAFSRRNLYRRDRYTCQYCGRRQPSELVGRPGHRAQTQELFAFADPAQEQRPPVGGGELPTANALARFQRNEVRVILLIDSAGGVGIDLHDTDGNYRRCTLVNPTDNAVVFKQVLGRAVRATGKSPVIQKIVCAKDTAEENVYNNLRAKLQRIAVINDADISDADLDPIQRDNKMENFIGELN